MVQESAPSTANGAARAAGAKRAGLLYLSVQITNLFVHELGHVRACAGVRGNIA